MLSEVEAPVKAKKPYPKRRASAVTSGRRLYVDEGNSNSAWSRRYRDLIAGHASDLGGRDTLSSAQLSLVRRVSAIECELERMEARLSQGDEVDLDVFTRSSSHLRRILETLGIERRPRDVTTPLSVAIAAARQRPNDDWEPVGGLEDQPEDTGGQYGPSDEGSRS